ncbi:hypothetical protein [Streptomyces sp. NPDC007070]|uniref:hypothetical protein n=1 Tax=Streptomyces sp. NPDC007070 TaxID=3154312 RepID=UPI0033FF21FA
MGLVHGVQGEDDALHAAKTRASSPSTSVGDSASNTHRRPAYQPARDNQASTAPGDFSTATVLTRSRPGVPVPGAYRFCAL